METQDKQIIYQILDADVERYRLIMDRYSQRVFALVVKIVSCEEDAEEITQDVFMKAFQNLSKFDFRSSVSTWLFRIAYNEAVNHTRRSNHQSEIALDDTLLHNISDAQVDNLLDSDDPRLAALPAAIEALSVEERALITLHYFEEMPLKEVAAMMRLGESAAKVLEPEVEGGNCRRTSHHILCVRSVWLNVTANAESYGGA